MGCELYFTKAMKISITVALLWWSGGTSWSIFCASLGTLFHPPAHQILTQSSSQGFKPSWYSFELMAVVILEVSCWRMYPQFQVTWGLFFQSLNNLSYSPLCFVDMHVHPSGGQCHSSHCTLQQRDRKTHARCPGKGPGCWRRAVACFLAVMLPGLSLDSSVECQAAMWGETHLSCFPLGCSRIWLFFFFFFTNLQRQNIKTIFPKTQTCPLLHQTVAWTMRPH